MSGWISARGGGEHAPPSTLDLTLPWLRRAGADGGAVATLRALLDRGLFEEAERRLAGGDQSSPELDAMTRSLRSLCVNIAEHGRRAEELVAEARRHRLAGEELRGVLEGLVDEYGRAAGGGHRPDPGAGGRPGWRDRLSGRPTRGADGTPMASPNRTVELVTAGSEVHRDHAAQGSPQGTVLEVRMLGGLRVELEGRPVERWRSTRARAVFQYLAFHAARPVRREQLMDTFWPGHTRDSARNNLNVAVHNLRRTLRGVSELTCVVYSDGHHSLNPDLAAWTDRDAFLDGVRVAMVTREHGQPERAIEAFEAATALYRGSLFEDDSQSEWHLGEQRHLEDTYLRALDALGQLHLEARALQRATETGERALACDPCRESTHRLLMRCYAQQHQHHLVSRQLDLCVRTLRERLGVSPAAETFRLFQQLTTAG